MYPFIKRVLLITLTCICFNISVSQAEENQKPEYVTACEEQYAFVSIFPPGMMDELIKSSRDNFRIQKEAQGRDGGGISEKEFKKHINKLKDPEAKEKEEAQKKIDECVAKAEAKEGDLNEAARDVVDEVNEALGKKDNSGEPKPKTTMTRDIYLNQKSTVPLPGGGYRPPAKVERSQSKIWKKLKNYQGSTKTNGKKGRKKRYYKWDHTHKDIEVYGKDKQHLGSIDATTGKFIKPPVKGRELNE